MGRVEAGAVRLTDLTTAGGCAAKYSAARLEQLLAGFVPVEAENLLVGLAPADDAAVYKLDDERALIFTLDFFPPLVDDPADFGAIAATNALNDVFAMGGSPLLALSIAAFPEELPVETLAAVFAAADVAGARGRRRSSPAATRSATPSRSTGSPWSAPCIPPGSGRRAARSRATRSSSRSRSAPASSSTASSAASAATGARGRGRVDADAEPRGRGRAAAVRAERGHRRDRLRPARPRARDGRAERRRASPRAGALARARRRARGRPRGRADGRRSRATASSRRRTSTRATVPDELLALGYDPQTAGGLLVSLPADRSVTLEAAFASRGLFLRRIGSVGEGAGVTLA